MILPKRITRLHIIGEVLAIFALGGVVSLMFVISLMP